MNLPVKESRFVRLRIMPLKEKKVVLAKALDSPFWGPGSVLYLDPGVVTFMIIY